MSDVAASIEIAAPVETVWAILDDPSRQGEWQESLVHVDVDAVPTRSGTTVREARRVPGGTRTVTYTITEHIPPTAYAFAGSGGPVRVEGRVELEPLGPSRCRLTARFHFTAGLRGKVLLPVVRREAARQLVDDQRRLKSLAERSRPAS